MRLSGEKVYIRPIETSDAALLYDWRRANREFFQPCEPLREGRFYSLEGQQVKAQLDQAAFANGTAYPFLILELRSDELVGRIELSGVARGPFQNAHLGYSVSHSHHGQGFGSEAVRLVLRFAFLEAELHRIQAAILPKNFASIRVLEKNGFRREGFAKRYLKINGKWQDHDLFAITQEEWRWNRPI